MDDIERNDARRAASASTDEWAGAADIDALLPEAEWLWRGLEIHCLAGCCGLDAFDFSEREVHWVCDGQVPRAGPSWPKRRIPPGEQRRVAEGLHGAAVRLRPRAGERVRSSRLGELRTATGFADLLEDLATKLDSVPEGP